MCFIWIHVGQTSNVCEPLEQNTQSCQGYPVQETPSFLNCSFKDSQLTKASLKTLSTPRAAEWMGLQAYLPRLKDLHEFYLSLSLITVLSYQERRHVSPSSQRWKTSTTLLNFEELKGIRPGPARFSAHFSLSSDVPWHFDLLMFRWALLKYRNVIVRSEQKGGLLCVLHLCALS